MYLQAEVHATFHHLWPALRNMCCCSGEYTCLWHVPAGRSAVSSIYNNSVVKLCFVAVLHHNLPDIFSSNVCQPWQHGGYYLTCRPP
jgi:hypothetical protein